MKKPLLLNVISIVLMIFGVFCVSLALFALKSFSHEKLAGLYGADYPAFYLLNICYAVVMGALLFTSGLLLFRGKEFGRKLFVASVVIMAVYVLATQGIKGAQGLGIPVLIIIFLYQYWGIKDYFAESRADKTETKAKSTIKVKNKKNKK